MPLSDVGIVNLTLSRIGSTTQINSLDPTVDSSNEAAQAAVLYPANRDFLLTKYTWPFAKGTAVLNQVSQPGVRWSQEWNYAYAYPTDALRVIRLVPTYPQSAATPPQTTGPGQVPFLYGNQPWKRADGNPDPWPFEVGNAPGNAAKLLLTDLGGQYTATAIYRQQAFNAMLWPADFQSVLAWRLGIDMSFALAISDNRRKACAEFYKSELYSAIGDGINEGQSDLPLIGYQAQTRRARWG